jgi:ADP-ribose pyrophosphatase YjhB (NUDIX family)
MKQSLKTPPKICFTASGCLIWKNKVLLVKHKKAHIWLKPGGHADADELLHKTAEREFFEETGILVRASQYGFLPKISDPNSEFLPAPFTINLHWVSRENYQARLQGKEMNSPWKRGCEQHCNYDFFLEPVDAAGKLLDASADSWPACTLNSQECDGIDWFAREQLDQIESTEDIRSELQYAFKLYDESRQKNDKREKDFNEAARARSQKPPGGGGEPAN